MLTRVTTIICLIIMTFNTDSSIAQWSTGRIPIIPAPVNVEPGQGSFTINEETVISFNDDLLAGDVELFNSYINTMYGFRLKAGKSVKKKENQISIFSTTQMDSDSYQLLIDVNGVYINGGKSAGVFYALQTLVELLPAGKTTNLTVPFIKIDDGPRFQYRGMHLDVVRHFFSVAVVKRYIDFLAMYKMNVFHWHLTDDQGWRIEIKKYPELQKVSAWRNGTLIGHLGDKPVRYDSLLYGGYYTQEEIKDVVNYALARHITIIPEIEMPGHALAALAAYPELSCTGGPFNVGTTWGVFKDVFCPKEETFQFLENVLDEVCTLFPGKYIHIGGDECPKDRWKECPHCQALIKKENLKDENDLQRYFTNRIATYLKTKNKTTIGWDEILEPGLDSDAVIMSWRGYKGGAEASVHGHDAVMSPSSHCYLDMYQSRYSDGRMAIGGYLPLERIYSFEPVPDVLTLEQSKHIIGAQGNVWSEYIADELRLQEMIFPRIAALSEVQWSKREQKDYNNFTARLVSHFKLLNFRKIKYSTAVYDISSRVSPNGNNGVYIELFSGYTRGKIYYNYNGSTLSTKSSMYTEKIAVDQSVTVYAALFEGAQQRGNVFTQTFNLNKATGKEVILANPTHVEYSRGGGFSLVNGVTGNLPWIPSEWLGFPGTDLDATIDLGSLQTISRVSVDVLIDEEGKIFLPKEVKVLISENGKDFILMATLDSSAINKMNRKLVLNFPQSQARWIKVIASNANGKDWLFVDEIGVE